METINSHMVITRKSHKCWGCAREFPKGSKLDRVTNVESGELTTVYFCPVCTEWFTETQDDEGVEFGSLCHDEDWIRIKRELEASK